MEAEKSWETEMAELITDMERDREKAVQRMEVARRSLQELDNDLATARRILERYREKYGLTKGPLPVDSVIAREYGGKSTREMLRHWAETHDGRIVMKEVCKALAAAQLFSDVTQARGSLFSAAQRMPELRKLQPGVFELAVGTQGGDITPFLRAA